MPRFSTDDEVRFDHKPEGKMDEDGRSEVASTISTVASTISGVFKPVYVSACASDILVARRYCEIVGLQDVPHTQRMVLKMMRMLHMCEYHFHDIVLIMAMAACHMKRVESVCTLKSMDASELTNIIVLQCFVAHSYVMDETCPLKCWHKNLFARYCPLKKLNMAIARLLELQGWSLAIPDEDLEAMLQAFHGNAVLNSEGDSV